MKVYLIYIVVIVLGQSCVSVKDQSVDFKKYDYIDSTKYRPEDKIFVGIYSASQHEVTIDLLQCTGNTIKVIQTMGPLDSQFGNTDPIFEDFNQDGILDLKLQYGTGGRGANTLFYLFIQNATGKLGLVRGSAEIPNLQFDTTRQVITGTYFYGGTSFVDFKLGKDSLIEISGVAVSMDSIWTHREYYSIDDNGKRVIVKKDSVADNGDGLYSRDPVD